MRLRDERLARAVHVFIGILRINSQEGINQRVSYSDSGREALFSYIGWIVLGALSPVFPYRLGEFIPILSIIASITDIGRSTGPAIFSAFVTLFLALIFQDQVTAVLSFIAIIVGFVSLVARATR